MQRPNVYPLCRELGKYLIQKKLTVAVAESCTGGGLAYALTFVPGCSQWFNCGLVTYTNQAKIDLLGVNADTLEQHGAVSIEVADEMARGVLKQSNAHVSMSITGIAGPSGGSKEKPVGTVCFGLAVRDGSSETIKKQFSGGRKHVCDCSVGFALKWLLNKIAN